MDAFDKLIKDMRKKVEWEKQAPIKPKKVCKICGKSLATMNEDGICFTHLVFDESDEYDEAIKTAHKKLMRGLNAKKSKPESAVSMPKL